MIRFTQVLLFVLVGLLLFRSPAQALQDLGKGVRSFMEEVSKKPKPSNEAKDSKESNKEPRKPKRSTDLAGLTDKEDQSNDFKAPKRT